MAGTPGKRSFGCIKCVIVAVTNRDHVAEVMYRVKMQESHVQLTVKAGDRLAKVTVEAVSTVITWYIFLICGCKKANKYWRFQTFISALEMIL